VRIMTLGTALLTATALALSASAQNAPTAPAITRTVVAATKLPSVVETPLHFKAMRVTLQPGGRSSLSAANGILYQFSGSTEISLGGENKMLSVGEAGVGSQAEGSRYLMASASNLYLPCGFASPNGRHVRPRCASVVTDRLLGVWVGPARSEKTQENPSDTWWSRGELNP
jgi:hypothetical protein